MKRNPIARFNVLRLLFYCCAALAAGYFIIGPSRLVSRLVSRHWPSFSTLIEVMNGHFYLIVFLLTLTTLVLYLWSQTTTATLTGKALALTPLGSKPRWAIGLMILFSMIIMARTISDLNAPLDWDEHEHVTLLAGPDFARALNPFYGSENHFLASLSAYGSMKLLGVNKWAARLPAIVYATGFLALLTALTIRYLSIATGICIFLVLTFNGMAIYSFHQMRGYAPLFLFSLATFYFATLALFHDNRLRNRVAFAVAAMLAMASHTFGGLFLGVLFLAVIVFLFNYRQVLPSMTRQAGQQIAWMSATLLILFAILSVFIIGHLEDTGFAMASAAPPKWLTDLKLYRPFSIFNFVRLWEIKLICCVIAIGVLLHLKSFSKTRPGPYHIAVYLLAALAVFVGALFYLIQFTVLEGRMLQPFLIFFLWWLFASYQSISRPALRLASLGGLLALLILPWWVHHDRGDGVSEFFASIEKYSERVKAIVADREDQRAQKHCYSFSGDPSTVGYLRHFYFHDERTQANTLDCSTHYHLFVEKGVFDRWSKIDAQLFSVSRVLYHDGKGRFLFAVPHSVTSLSANQR